MRGVIKSIHHSRGNDNKKIILDYFQQFLAQKPDVVLISAYTMYFDVCQDISKVCSELGIPVIVGGSAFVEVKIARLWSSILGVSAVYAGEPELDLMNIIIDIVAGKDVRQYPGIYNQSSEVMTLAPPLTALGSLSFPDFSDFPWDLYPNRVIPLMTGRGCKWDICTFCSDVSTASGRSFRSRKIESVINEMQHQSSRFNANLFAFLDLKLNSDLSLWRGLISHIPQAVPKAQWTASIHIDTRIDNGLSREDQERQTN